MKNVGELYKKYYNTYKSDYDTDNELNEAKKEKFDHNQFELFDTIDQESNLDKEREEFIEEIKEKGKGIDKKGFSKCFGYDSSALVSKLFKKESGRN